MRSALKCRLGSLFAASSSFIWLNLDHDSRTLSEKFKEFKLSQSNTWNNSWDNKSAYSMPDKSVKSCSKLIILVRHGQYETEAESAGKKVLTDLGWEQARLAGLRLRHLGYSIDCIVHSDMIRARQTTAAIISELDQMQLRDTGIIEITDKQNDYLDRESENKEFSLVPSPLKSNTISLLESADLAEGPPPVEPEPASESRIKRIAGLSSVDYADRLKHQQRIEFSFTNHVHRYPITAAGKCAISGPSDCKQCLPNGACSSSTCACNRCLQNQPLEVIIFVGHANVFRYWLCRALQLPCDAWLRFSLPHGSLTELLIEQCQPDDKVTNCFVSILRIGDDGHLPLKLQSR